VNSSSPFELSTIPSPLAINMVKEERL
jgi:hypothetical protein